MSDLDVNLADLKDQYLERGRPVRAAALLRDARSRKAGSGLAHLLRDHRDETVLEPETEKRDSFDFLLAYYGLLEIACLINYVPREVPASVRKEAQWNLSHGPLRKYYEELYPILLPRLLRLRLEGKLALREKDPGHATQALYVRFLGLVNRVRDDPEVELFQWFLDSGTTGGVGIEDTLNLLRSPSDTTRALLADPAKRDTRQRSVSGAQKFVSFCAELESHLQDAARFPLFQSALWTYYGYWFERIRDQVGQHVGSIFDAFLAWAPGPADSDSIGPDRKAIEAYVNESRRVLDRLLSGNYGRALREAASGATSDGI